ncbi:heavy-metal-associated domain-containing protein [Chelativorans alearense]|uniref:heavy-metal-associated domain-containing protein n=1 Tax=Chelativorans alearense TaxID=2681495 RepID=UPI0013CF9E90|nr:cation transporter [Chelativorans alearense]
MHRPSLISAAMLALGAAGILPAGLFSPLSMQSAAAQEAVARTATFAVENMTCALCPLTVKSAMKRVEGVQSVQVDFEAKTVTVTYDPSRATAQAIAAASTNAGYPAAVKG